MLGSGSEQKSKMWQQHEWQTHETLWFLVFSQRLKYVTTGKQSKIQPNAETKFLISSTCNVSSWSYSVKNLCSNHVCTEFGVYMVYIDGPVCNTCQNCVLIASLHPMKCPPLQFVDKRDISLGSRGDNSFSWCNSSLRTLRAVGHELQWVLTLNFLLLGLFSI